jgi:ATP-binding cassette subfamily B protein/subfamily B ATP-binding cassette protein MsbA
LKPALRKLVRPYLAPLLDPSPAAGLIRQSARRQWKLLAVSVGSGLLGSLGEGGTLGVIFLAVGLMTSKSSHQLAQLPLLQSLPWLKGVFVQVDHWPPAMVFVLLLGLAVGLQLLVSLCNYLNGVAGGYFGAKLNREVTALLNRRILSFSYPCASGYRVGDLLDYAGNAGNTVQNQINLANQLLVNIFMLAVYLTVLIAISPWLLLVALLLAAALTGVQRILLPRIRQNAYAGQVAAVEIGSRITENIQGLRLLHSSGGLSQAAAQFDSLLNEVERVKRRSARLETLIAPLSALLPILAIALIAGVSVVVFANRASGVLPSLVTFVLALQRLNVRLGGLASLATNYASSTAQVDRLNAILRDDGKQFVRTGGKAFHQLQSQIHLADVSLRYSPDLPPALHQIDLLIPSGQTVALVGASGAGKSSIADLLVGLYQPTEGKILIDGQDLNQLDLASWQQQLGVVSQDTFLFNATIAANIAYGSPDAERSAIEAAARMAQADGFIKALPDGYDTLVGERGYRLSGGQRQRLSLARALLRRPQLLILDEATSALDSQSERLVQEAIERFERGHTVLVIAHRLSTIVNADLICVLDQGRIVERGRHGQLLERGGRYASLWQQQISQRKPLEVVGHP